MLEHGTYYTGLLKTASRCFPKKYINTHLLGLEKSYEEIQRQFKQRKLLEIIRTRYMDMPGMSQVQQKILLSTCNHTLPVDDHEKRWRINPETRLSENIIRTVPRTQMIKSYFEAACAIDVHNHLRQDGLALECTVRTHDWWFRCLCTIIGMIEVDAFKAYSYFNEHKCTPKYQEFVEKLAIPLLTKKYEGSVSQDTEVRLLRKRVKRIQQDESFEEENPTIHHIVPIAEYLREVNQKNENHIKHGSSLRCLVCPMPAPAAFYCCSSCSNANHRKPFAIYGSKSGRTCLAVHTASAAQF